MSEPTGAQTDRETGARTYYDPVTGKRLPSVTTITGVIAKPHLYAWYAKMAAERAFEQRGTWEEMGKGDAVQFIKDAAFDKKTAAGARGTRVHDYAEADLRGERPDIPEDVRPYVDAYLKFRSDHTPEFHHTEISIVNRTYQYGGAADFVMTTWETFAVPVVGDWKTGNTGPWPEWLLQMSAYTRGECLLIKEGSLLKAAPMPTVSQDQVFAVRLLPGRYELWENDVPLDKAFRAFKAARILYEWGKVKKPFRRR
ncbi:MAG: hypothetical protein ACREMY_09520 [bacterium]